MFSSQKQPVVFDYENKADYLSALESYRRENYASPDGMQRLNVALNEFKFNGASPKFQDIGSVQTVLWDETLQDIECEVNITKEGLYTFGFIYSADTSSNGNIIRSMKVDGNYQYRECESLVLPRRWENTHEVSVNSAGDEVAPIMTQSTEIQNEPLIDGEGRYSEPFQIYLSSGRHLFTFGHISMSVYLAGFFLDVYEAPKPYEEVSASYRKPLFTHSMNQILRKSHLSREPSRMSSAERRGGSATTSAA